MLHVQADRNTAPSIDRANQELQFDWHDLVELAASLPIYRVWNVTVRIKRQRSAQASAACYWAALYQPARTLTFPAVIGEDRGATS